MIRLLFTASGPGRWTLWLLPLCLSQVQALETDFSQDVELEHDTDVHDVAFAWRSLSFAHVQAWDTDFSQDVEHEYGANVDDVGFVSRSLSLAQLHPPEAHLSQDAEQEKQTDADDFAFLWQPLSFSQIQGQDADFSQNVEREYAANVDDVGFVWRSLSLAQLQPPEMHLSQLVEQEKETDDDGFAFLWQPLSFSQVQAQEAGLSQDVEHGDLSTDLEREYHADVSDGAFVWKSLSFFRVRSPETDLAKDVEQEYDTDVDDAAFVWQLSGRNPYAYPRFAGETYFEVEYNSTFDSDDKEDELDDWLVNIDSEQIFWIRKNLFVASDLRIVLEPEDIPGIRTFRTDFPKSGLYIRDLFVQYDSYPYYSVFGGKYEPVRDLFGQAPIYFGNYNTDVNFEQSIGLGGTLALRTEKFGHHFLTGQAFYFDTSRLSAELFSGDNRLRKSDGGVGNTERLNNYLITLNGRPVGPQVPVFYTVGAGEQKKGEGDPYDQSIVLGSLYGAIPLPNEADLELSADFLSLGKADGENVDTDSVTLGVGYADWPFYIGLAYSKRWVDERDPQEDDSSSTVVEVVLRHAFTDFISTEAAYQWTKEDIETQSFGIVLIYSFDWLIR